jgi:O-antigen/teichoic acid export membrane protein
MNAQTIIRGSTVRVLGLLANTLIGFFLMPFLVRHLGDRMYGYWVLAGSIVGYYGILDLGIVSAVQYQVAKAVGEKDTETANRAISTSFFVFGALGCVILLCTVIFAALSRHFIQKPVDATLFAKVILVMGAGLAIGFSGRAFIGAISAHLRLDLVAGYSLILLLARTGLIVFLIQRGLGILALAVITVSIDFINYIIYYLILRDIQRPLRLSIKLFSWTQFRSTLGYSTNTLIIKLSDQLRFYVDSLVVSAFVSVAAVTHYAIGSRLAFSFAELIIAMVGTLSPWYSILLGRKDHDGILRAFRLATKISASVSAIIVCCLIAYGRPFITWWMGPAYSDSYWPLVFLASAIFCDVSQQPSFGFLFGVSRHRFLAILTMLEGLVNVGLSIYFARIFGAAGVALGTLIPMAVAKFLIQPLYVCRVAGMSPRSYFLNLYGRSVMVPALAIVVPWFFLFRRLVNPQLASLAFVIPVAVLLSALPSFYFVLDENEREKIMTGLKRTMGIKLVAGQPAAHVPQVLD